MYETQDHLITCLDNKYIGQDQFDKIWELSMNAIKVLDGYIRYLKKKAADAYEKCVPILEKIEGDSAASERMKVLKELGDTMTGLAGYYQKTPTLERAVKAYEQALAMMNKEQHARERSVVLTDTSRILLEIYDSEKKSAHLALDEVDREQLHGTISIFQRHYRGLYLAFPGDESDYDGCLAAGRGFVHVSADGNLEPCPFAPFSDVNLKGLSLVSPGAGWPPDAEETVRCTPGPPGEPDSPTGCNCSLEVDHQTTFSFS